MYQIFAKLDLCFGNKRNDLGKTSDFYGIILVLSLPSFLISTSFMSSKTLQLGIEDSVSQSIRIKTNAAEITVACLLLFT